jgi:hypothetical protein
MIQPPKFTIWSEFFYKSGNTYWNVEIKGRVIKSYKTFHQARSCVWNRISKKVKQMEKAA